MKGYLILENEEKIEFELYPELAPKTVANFVRLINEKYYDGKTFHRVIPDFVSQGGCPNGDGSGDLGYTIPCECNPKLTHEVGSLSMAHRGKNTGCCQFFIVHTPQPHLNGVHSVFGKVTHNMKAVLNMKNHDKIKVMRIKD